eukprot:CAMPEP_0170535936 /NCGR_PEP_ID=MMETSP0209-20121228/101873_1 /TAXON_ID=665100 ORGANISM="Litonotus pictus, Strain P1" /NCGR_SAMPLE_ID=MMETSP0209 /ASSEMBLY_ACC=CAM_ASM_000301 /LENGTH=195 /DNA_ID=CAMNT_0010837249 /DNA_START=130 /DNA_END=717 /DNA_ORIENTATION=+
MTTRTLSMPVREWTEEPLKERELLSSPVWGREVQTVKEEETETEGTETEKEDTPEREEETPPEREDPRLTISALTVEPRVTGSMNALSLRKSKTEITTETRSNASTAMKEDMFKETAICPSAPTQGTETTSMEGSLSLDPGPETTETGADLGPDPPRDTPDLMTGNPLIEEKDPLIPNPLSQETPEDTLKKKEPV